MIANGTLIDDKFEVLSTLGVGGFGTVVKARQLKLDRLVAIKLLKTTLLSEPDGIPRFEREAKAISALKQQNIVAFHGYGVWLDAPYMVMEYIEGPSLELAIANGQIEPHRALRIMIQVLQALKFAHQHGVVHRDLKPSNIMLIPGNNGSELVKIIDFGLAKLMPGYGLVGQKLTETGYTLGSCHYMSPEQALGNLVDQRADIYSTGCIFQQILTGQLPFDATDNVALMFQHINLQPPALSLILDDNRQTAALQVFLDNCLAKDPEDRYTDAAQAIQDAQALLAGRYDSVSPCSDPKRSRHFPAKVSPTLNRSNLLVSSAVITALLMCSTYYLFNKQPSLVQPTKIAGSAELAREITSELNSGHTNKPNIIQKMEEALTKNRKDKQLEFRQAFAFAQLVSDYYFDKGMLDISERYHRQAQTERILDNERWLTPQVRNALANAKLPVSEDVVALDLQSIQAATASQPDDEQRVTTAWHLGSFFITLLIDEDKLKDARMAADWLKQELAQSEFYRFYLAILLGNLDLASRNYKAAEQHFKKAQTARWNVPAWSWLGLARCELYQDNLPDARQYALKAIETTAVGTDPERSFQKQYAKIILATIAARKKDRKSAEELTEDLPLLLHPGVPLSPAILNDGDICQAAVAFRQANFGDLVPRLRILGHYRLVGLGDNL